MFLALLSYLSFQKILNRIVLHNIKINWIALILKILKDSQINFKVYPLYKLECSVTSFTALLCFAAITLNAFAAAETEVLTS